MLAFLEGLRRPALVGVVHLAPLPGAPRHHGDPAAPRAAALADARILVAGGCDALLVENFGDAPFFAERVPPETVAAMALVLGDLARELPGVPLGVNVLRNDARAALGLCAASGAAFLRVNVLAGAAAPDQGLVEGRAAGLLRERARLAPRAAILADVHVKHATQLDPRPIGAAAAELVERALADAVVVTGAATGMAPAAADLAAVRLAIGDRPLLVGSGVTPEGARALLAEADGAIVGTALKRGGDVRAPVELERVRALRRAMGG